MQEIMVEKIHKEVLRITNEVVQILDKHQITYYIIGGTLLGAIRHKGFIPWDDDVDIAVPRPDYNRLLCYAKNELSGEIDIQTDFTYQLRFVSTKIYGMYALNEKECEVPLAVDILPIDGTPNNHVAYLVFKFRILVNRAKHALLTFSIDRKRHRPWHERMILFLADYIPIWKLSKLENVKKKIDKIVMKQDVDKCRNIGTFMGAYRFREVVPREYFGKPTPYEFEGCMFNGPEMWHEYLTHIYGPDYLELPPVEKRKIHYYSIIEKE